MLRIRFRESGRCSVLGTLVVAFALAGVGKHAPAACLVEGGAPTCDAAPDPGSADKRVSKGQHVGNPIDVVTGNKYQAGDDYRAPDTPLAFTRHYNSSLVEHDLGLGRGWRHSYAVVLTKGSDGSFRIVQSDGRRIEFAAEAAEEGVSGSIHLAQSPGDGRLTTGPRHIWYPDDGRAYTFNGSYLVRIDYPDKQSLMLRYHQRRLQQVTDSAGRTLRLEYADDSAGLGRYGDPAHVPAGHLERLQLPDGSSIHYHYDSRLNLVAAIDDAGSRLDYRYDDPHWPSHLGAVSDEGVLTGRWKYDETGRAVTWQSRDSGDYGNLTYLDDARLVDVGRTRVMFASGRYGIYDWATAADGSHYVTSFENTQESASKEERRSLWESLQDIEPIDVEWGERRERSGPAARLSTRRSSRPSTVDAFIEVDVTLDDGRQLSVALAFDRLGNLDDVRYGNLRLLELAERALRMPDRRRLRDMYTDEGPSFEERMTVLTESAEETLVSPEIIEQTIMTLLDLGDMAERQRLEPTATGPPTFRNKQIDPNGPACPLPKDMDCAEAQDARDLAELSRCAYSGATCNTRFQRVDPVSLGMSAEDYVVGGLPVYLYFDSVNDRYVLAFRGTENGRDAYEDGRNLMGMSSEQYNEARRLGDRLNRVIRRESPGSELAFTGHSLGGGLATVAALRTDRFATVFNAASVTRGTAGWNGLDQGNTGYLIHNVVVDGEIVTRGQRFGEIINSLLGGTADSPGPFPGNASPNSSTIPKPPAPWIDARQEPNAMLSEDVEREIVLHSMDAVIYSLDYLIDEHCTP